MSEKTQRRIETYRGSVARFSKWVEDSLSEKGGGWKTRTSAEGYFSLAVYANQIGRSDWTQRILRYVLNRFMSRDGELQQGPKRDRMITYIPAWLAWAAADAEAYELSAGILENISSYQDPRSGGFFAGKKERDNQKGLIEFDGTTMSTIALAGTGRVEQSVRGADYLINMCQVQPEPVKRFFTGWVEPDGLLTQPEETDLKTVLDWAEPRQHYYKAGLLVVALAQVYGATGCRKYLDTAVEIYRTVISRASDLWTNTISHKMCWAATTLFHITRNADYLEHACRFADHLVGVQQPDGAFTYPEAWPSYPPELWELIPNAGAQFALWIFRTLRALEAGLAESE